MLSKQQILTALQAWIRQRPGLEFCNYGKLKSYRAELRSIAKDKRDAEQLLTAVAIRDSITAEDLMAAFSAYSGRLTIKERTKQHTPKTCPGRPCSKDCDHKEFKGAELSYCTGQYWPTEYRRAACAVLAAALWARKREDMPKPNGKITRIIGVGPFARKSEHDNINGETPGDWIRASFKREFGRSIQQRWFD